MGFWISRKVKADRPEGSRERVNLADARAHCTRDTQPATT